MKDAEIWPGKNLTNLLEDIHAASLDKRDTIKDIIKDLRGMLKDAESIVMIAPIIKDYIDVMVRSDEHLVKIATIVQRIIAAETLKGSSENGMLSDEDMQKLQEDVHAEQTLAHKELMDSLTELEKTIPASGSASL